MGRAHESCAQFVRARDRRARADREVADLRDVCTGHGPCKPTRRGPRTARGRNGGSPMKRKNVDIIRAWKDEAYRASLTDEQRASLPEHPVGPIDLSDAQLAGVIGGMRRQEPDRTT